MLIREAPSFNVDVVDFVQVGQKGLFHFLVGCNKNFFDRLSMITVIAGLCFDFYPTIKEFSKRANRTNS